MRVASPATTSSISDECIRRVVDRVRHITQSGGKPPSLPATQAAAFENFIKSTLCLHDARGQILVRDTWRNPCQNLMNVSSHTGTGPVTGQPTFTFNPAFQKFLISNNPTNYYQLQLSARLSF
ncbi:MAG TPA: hypothetical protein VIC24_15830 [Gemmatimonadaceae bacterium]